MKIKVDPEFSSLIPAVSPELDGELETEVLRDDRFTDPLIVWKHQNILLDGHRRHRLMTKHPHLKAPPPVMMDFESRQEAHDWIIRHQLAKRNVSDAQRKYLLGKLWSDRTPPKVTDSLSATNGGIAEVAEAHGVTERTVRRSAEFAEAVDAVPEVKSAVLSGEVKASTKDLEALAELPAKQKEKAAAAIANGKAPSVGAAVKAAQPETKKDVPLVDAEGKPVPARLRPFFERASEFEAHCKQLTDIAKWIEETATTDIGVHLSPQSIVADLRNAKSAIRFAKPYAICPYCKGSGQYKHEKCMSCKGVGFVGRNKLKSAPAEMRA